MNNSDELHCHNCGGTYDQETGDHLDDGECVCCECCCQCLACEYGPRDGLGMTDEQRAPARDFLAGLDDVPPNAGSAE